MGGLAQPVLNLDLTHKWTSCHGNMYIMELLIMGFTNWLICLDHRNQLVHRLTAQRPLKRASILVFLTSYTILVHHLLRNISTKTSQWGTLWHMLYIPVARVLNSHHISWLLSLTLRPVGVISQFIPRRKVFFPVKTHLFPWKRKKYLSSGKIPNPGWHYRKIELKSLGLSLLASFISSDLL